MTANDETPHVYNEIPTSGSEFELANWHAARMLLAQSRIDEINERFDDARDVLERQRDLALGQHKTKLAFHRSQVEAAHRLWHAAGTESLTVHLPCGVTSRLTRPRTVPTITDEELFLAWAAEQGLDDHFRPPPPAPPRKIAKDEVNKSLRPREDIAGLEPRTRTEAVWVSPDGEIVTVPGVEYVAPDRKWEAR